MEAISGVDIALWDIAAKAVGVPLNKLLGGTFRQRVKVYASSIPGERQDAPPEAWDAMRRTAADVKQRGFQAVKMGLGLGVTSDIRSARFLRDAVGPEFEIFVDAGALYDLPQAVDAAANNNARSMLERDVQNITDYYGQFARELLGTHYAQEMWALFEEGALHPDHALTGHLVYPS